MGIGTFMFLISWIIAYYVIVNFSIQSQKQHKDFFEVTGLPLFIDKPEKELSLKRMVINITINSI